ncbi:MAG: helix-turn-helix domain-containing protein [Pseudomonadota bacterium]
MKSSKNIPAESGEALLDSATDIFIQGAGKISSALLGMINKVGGQIYAILFLSDEPLSLDDIAEKLAVSKSNVSINIRMLEDYSLVRKVWVKGSRKDYYAAERAYPRKVLRDFLEKIQGTLTDAITTIERTRARASEAKVALVGDKKEKAEFILDQVNLIGLFYYAASQFFEDFFAGKEINLDLLRQTVLNTDEVMQGKEK